MLGGMVLATVLEGVELASHLHPKQELPVERSLVEEVEGQPDSTVQPDGLQSAEEEEEVLLHRSMVVLLMPIQEADRGEQPLLETLNTAQPDMRMLGGFWNEKYYVIIWGSN